MTSLISPWHLWTLSSPLLLQPGFHGISSLWGPFPQSFADGSDALQAGIPPAEQVVVAQGLVTIMTPLMWGLWGGRVSSQGTELFQVLKIPALVLVIDTRLWEQLQVRAVPLSSAFAFLSCFPPLLSLSSWLGWLPAPHTALFYPFISHST